MRFLAPFAAGLWLLIVGLQGLHWLVTYGLIPVPLALPDWTPAYTPLMLLVVVAALVQRYAPETPEIEPREKGRDRK